MVFFRATALATNFFAPIHFIFSFKTLVTMTVQSKADAAAGGAPKPSLSKRQRRKHVNPSNTWPQQPKIQSPAARVKANLRVAGLLSSTSATSLDPALDLHSPEMRFGKILADPEQRKRHQAVAGLRAYLKDRCDIHNADGGISELDLLKLWKGLWHTLYLADKAPVQEELSKRLAELLWCVAGTEEEDEYAAQMYLDMCDEQDEDVVMEEVFNTLDENSGDEDETSEEEVPREEDDSEDSNDDDDEVQEGDSNDDLEEREEEEMDDERIQHCRGAHLAALFVKTFFQTMQREWGNMDKHRIDKFYTLVRLVLHEIFEYMSARHWNRGIILLFNDTIRDEVLFWVPNGLRCHLIDITVDELGKVNAKAPMPLTEATFLDCLDPYFALAQNSDDSMVHERVMEHIFGKFLEEYSFVSEVEDDSLVFDQVHVGTIATFLFDLGSDVDTQERYRKPLYDMHKRYIKRTKQVGNDVVMGAESSCASLDVEEETAQDDEEDNHEIVKEPETTANNRKRLAAKEDTKLRETPEITSHMETHDKADKKRKKSKREKESPPEPVGESPPVVEAEKDDTREPEKKKAKKKNTRKSTVGADKGDKEKEEEVITISCSEQKKAAEAATEVDETEPSPKKDKKKKKKSKKNQTPEKTTKVVELTSEQKRVKFGRVNYSKSHTASMKALKTMEKPPLKPPGRGILRSKSPAGKGQSAAGSSKKTKSRKRATSHY
jgi:hypothetical protein